MVLQSLGRLFVDEPVRGSCRRATGYYGAMASIQHDQVIPNAPNLKEFIVHGLPYVFVPELGEVTRGMPTSYAGPPLSSSSPASGDLPPVWPEANGEVRYPEAQKAADMFA